jgi:hypothetical protein
MASPTSEDDWDAVSEEKAWRDTAERGRLAQDQLEQKCGDAKYGFYTLCLAELDAVVYFARPECFTTRSVFLAELRRLMTEPTAPSRPVPSLTEYQHGQKFWLEFMIKKYERGS